MQPGAHHHQPLSGAEAPTQHSAYSGLEASSQRRGTCHSSIPSVANDVFSPDVLRTSAAELHAADSMSSEPRLFAYHGAVVDLEDQHAVAQLVLFLKASQDLGTLRQLDKCARDYMNLREQEWTRNYAKRMLYKNGSQAYQGAVPRPDNVRQMYKTIGDSFRRKNFDSIYDVQVLSEGPR